MFDLTRREIPHGLAIAGRSLVGRWRQTAALVAVAALMSMAGLAASSSAATKSPSVAPAAVHVNSAAPWHYVASYFWFSDCLRAGNFGKIDHPNWYNTTCINGGVFSNWELWAQYW
jgi:hypothetical protein